MKIVFTFSILLTAMILSGCGKPSSQKVTDGIELSDIQAYEENQKRLEGLMEGPEAEMPPGN
ncbi:hypothetical protein Q31b_18470 [Novipirellula aureliae]|uniref:Uncharacterized protein n=1 Tax=Novipirellula aureliae TaxID=2527966 RepID=A0A5C6E9B4_9BACT|nr:hypothetical protein [Novipirellula aureliae]TWU44311.1 hypothetical protein Q31b_18470 [Novipirellula aureliae]